MTTRAAIYARVSSKKQEKAESIKSQLHVLNEYVRRQPGWRLIDTYIDDGKSAKTGRLDKRDGLARLLRDVEAKRFDVLVVLDISRLTRTDSIEERALILGPIQRRGIDIVTPSGGVQDLRSFLGEFYVMLQAQVAAEENRKRGESIAAGKLRAIAEGKKDSGITKFGWSYDRHAPPGQWWSIHPVNGPLIVEIFERIRDGETLRQVADSMTDRGFERPRGGAWTLQRVRQLVIYETYYTGEMVRNRGQGLSIKVPPIVSPELWHAANATLSRHGKRGIKRQKHPDLLQGMAICALCGSDIWISSYGVRTERRTYVCRKRREPPRGVDPCTLPHRAIADVDAALWKQLVAFVQGRHDLTGEAIGRRRASAEGNLWREDLKKAEAHLARHVRAEATILGRFREGLIGEDTMDAELKASARARKMLERQVETARRAAAIAANAEANGKGLGDLIAKLRKHVRQAATPAQKRRLLEALLGDKKVVVGVTEVRATIRLSQEPAERPADSPNVVAGGTPV